MEAIVLSHQRSIPVVEHMVRRYLDLWPNHPFVFRVPESQPARDLAERFPDIIRLIPVGNFGIRATVLDLLRGLSDETWVYWCIDDKYPIHVNVRRMNNLVKSVASLTDPAVAAVCPTQPSPRRWRRLDTNTEVRIAGRRFRDRQNWNQIWLHQFARVRLLRELMDPMPTELPAAKVMDSLLSRRTLPRNTSALIIRRSLMIVGESTTRGMLTRNCAESMRARGLSIEGFEISDRRLIRG